jgi:hypothetical protein
LQLLMNACPIKILPSVDVPKGKAARRWYRLRP